VPPGKWGTHIVFWRPVTKTVRGEDGTDEEDRFFVLRLYTVFNVDQVEGLDHLRAGQLDAAETPAVDYRPAEEAVEAARVGMGVRLVYGGGRAFYRPTDDYIQVPPRATFESPGEFYGTVFHELVHATGTPPGSAGPARTVSTPTPWVSWSPSWAGCSSAGSGASRRARTSRTYHRKPEVFNEGDGFVTRPPPSGAPAPTSRASRRRAHPSITINRTWAGRPPTGAAAFRCNR
jgi:hypothetical protein